jgi:hypothetical protein
MEQSRLEKRIRRRRSEHQINSHPRVSAALPRLSREVASGRTTPNAAAQDLLSYLEIDAAAKA